MLDRAPGCSSPDTAPGTIGVTGLVRSLSGYIDRRKRPNDAAGKSLGGSGTPAAIRPFATRKTLDTRKVNKNNSKKFN